MASRLDEGTDAEITDINVTPLVDVTLVLLVIFMVTASLVFTRSLPVNLPKSETSEAAVQASWVVVVKKSGDFMLNGKRIAKAELSGRMRNEVKLNPSLKVDLAADEGLAYGKVVGALDLLKKEGVKRVVLSVNTR